MEKESRIRVTSELEVVRARDKGRILAAELGLPSTELTAVATAISELARNILLYAETGDIILQLVPRGTDRSSSKTATRRDQAHRLAETVGGLDFFPDRSYSSLRTA